jgi:hypothetical protein
MPGPATLSQVQSTVAAGHRIVTRSALDGFRSTPENRHAGTSQLRPVANGSQLVRPYARDLKPERGAGSAVRRSAAEPP